MTASGAEALKAELERLKRVERPAIIAAIAEARAHGDLKENAEYHAAKEKQSFLEGRIQELESKISHLQIIDISHLPNEGKVIFGSTVTLVDVETDANVCYQIVGEEEADIKLGKISISSPIARALIGKECGDEVDVKTPGGMVTYEISDVRYV
jgi:transcription elongation factor GreA